MPAGLALAIALLVLAGCASRRGGQFLSPDPPQATAVAALIARSPLGPGENIRPVELQRGMNSSVSLVQVRDREPPHVHTRYDLTVTIAAGSGTLWLNGQPLRMGAGDTAFIPKGTPHYFVNEGSEPAAAIVVFSPPFTGPDQQPAPQQ